MLGGALLLYFPIWVKFPNDIKQGFTYEAMTALKLEQGKAISQDKTIPSNLVMDEMITHDQVEWTEFQGMLIEELT